MDSTEQGTEGRFGSPGRSVLVAIGLTIAGLLASELGTIPAIFVDPALADPDQSATRQGFLLAFALGFVGMTLAGAAYLRYSGRGLSYVDLRVPSFRDWKYAVAGVVGALVVAIAVNMLGQYLGVPGADHSIVDTIGTDSTLVLYLIVMVFLFNAPAEEFLFRNIVQKRLYDAFPKMQAVVIASLIFAVIHFPVYAITADAMSSVGTSLLSLFGGSLIFGWVFVRTDNLVVPALAHAGLNSFSFIQLYVLIEYYPEQYAEMMGLLLPAAF